MKLLKLGITSICFLAAAGAFAPTFSQMAMERLNGGGSYTQLDRIERNIEQMARQLDRIERILRLGGGGGGQLQVQVSVDVDCLGDLVEWNTSHGDRISASNTCRSADVEALEQRGCFSVQTENNEACYDRLVEWNYSVAEKSELKETCKTRIYQCR